MLRLVRYIIMPNDTERLDFLANLPTAELIKRYSETRGAHLPWVISVGGMPPGGEYDNFRDAVDDAMRREPTWIPKSNAKMSRPPKQK